MTEKKVNKSWMPIAIVAILLFVVAGSVALFNEKEVIPEGYKSPTDIQGAVDNAVSPLNVQLDEANSKIADLTTQLADKVIEEVEQAKETLGYLIDKVFLNADVDKTVSDREVKTLFDGTVEVGSETYDAEEVMELDGLKVLANEKDFEGVPYLTIPRNSISYKVVFEDALVTSTIDDEDNQLIFNFLGQEITIVDWNVDTVTFFSGDVYYLEEGVAQTINGNEVELVFANDDSANIRVGDNSKEVKEGVTKTIGDLQVKVEYVFETTNFRVGQAKVVIGEDVENEVMSGDEFAEDSIWNYVIDEHSIGIILNDDFSKLDNELMPLAVGEKTCLPNEYVCVRFDGMLEEDMNEVTFELEDGFVEVRGEFQSGLNDYKKILVNSTGIYNDDDEEITSVTIGSSDVKFELAGLGIRIEDFEVNLNLNSSSVSSRDYDQRTDFGIVVSNSEDAIEDQSWNIVVPSEKLEATITLL